MTDLCLFFVILLFVFFFIIYLFFFNFLIFLIEINLIILKKNNNKSMEKEQIIYHLNNQIHIISFILQIINIIIKIKFPKIKKLFQKIQKKSKKNFKIFKKKQVQRKSVSISQFDIFGLCGIFENTFEHIYSKLQSSIVQARSYLAKGNKIVCTVLEPRVRLLLLLHWLREYPKYKTLALQFSISVSTVSREIKHLLPKVYTALNLIQWPKQFSQSNFKYSSIAIDCAAYFRWRVHPNQADW